MLNCGKTSVHRVVPYISAFKLSCCILALFVKSKLTIDKQTILSMIKLDPSNKIHTLIYYFRKADGNNRVKQRKVSLPTCSSANSFCHLRPKYQK